MDPIGVVWRQRVSNHYHIYEKTEYKGEENIRDRWTGVTARIMESKN